MYIYLEETLSTVLYSYFTKYIYIYIIYIYIHIYMHASFACKGVAWSWSCQWTFTCIWKKEGGIIGKYKKSDWTMTNKNIFNFFRTKLSYFQNSHVCNLSSQPSEKCSNTELLCSIFSYSPNKEVYGREITSRCLHSPWEIILLHKLEVDNWLVMRRLKD